MSYETIIDKIKNHEMFSFSRWGDGEFNCVFQDTKSRANCDGHEYFEDLGYKLKMILYSMPHKYNNYFLGLQNLAKNQRPQQINDLGLEWHNANVFYKASLNGELQPLIDALDTRDVILVGGGHLKPYADKHNWKFIEVPRKNCWLAYNETRELIRESLADNIVILYATSMMANVLVHDFYGQATNIDIGSVLDPYVGVLSRTYHKDLKI